MSRPTILFLVTEDWYFWTHRLGLAQAIQRRGFDVALAARFTAHRARIEAAGIRCIPLEFVRTLRNPLHELRVVWQVSAIVGRVRPSLVHAVALKPILLSVLAVLRYPQIAFCHAVAGLGHLFASQRPLVRGVRAVVTPVLRALFARRNCWLVAQHADDLAGLVARHIGCPARAIVIRGAGVDLETFRSLPPPVATQPLVVLPARMLLTKGIHEFVAAAKELRARGIPARCALVGGVDPAAAGALTAAELAALCADGIVEWWGHREDMAEVLPQAAIVCLPSYREGVPKALLEAAACGRPMVATDIPGCREVCRQGQTGLLVPVRDVPALVEALQRLLVDSDLRLRLGQAARELVEREFSAELIHAQTLAFYERCLAGQPG